MLMPENVFLMMAPVDMRCGIDKLTQYVTNTLNTSWQNRTAFIFCNKSRSRIKLLRWDRHGVWLASRRLHRGHFIWPHKGDTVWSLNREQFNWLIKGIDWSQVEGPRKARTVHSYLLNESESILPQVSLNNLYLKIKI